MRGEAKDKVDVTTPEVLGMQKGETFLKQYADLTDSEMATIRNIPIEKKASPRGVDFLSITGTHSM